MYASLLLVGVKKLRRRMGFKESCHPLSYTISLPTMPKLTHYQDVAIEHASRVAASVRSSLHIAFIYGKGGALLAMATNKIGSRSQGAGYSKYTIHAERAALKAVGDNSLLRGAVLVVVRLNKLGELACSKPCHGCMCHLQKAMDAHGLRRVYYS